MSNKLNRKEYNCSMPLISSVTGHNQAKSINSAKTFYFIRKKLKEIILDKIISKIRSAIN